jgi:tyrosinase
MGAGAQTVRVRKNVQTLGGSQDDLFWYAKAVADLKLRPVADPTSWRYQAAVHGYNPDSDPNRRIGGPLPSTAEQERFWSQCQHQTWYFLPWHRGYLAYFEQIVAAAVVKLNGPPNWALPYWNYSAHNPQSRLMPDAFVRPTLLDGTPNPLFVAGRNSHTNNSHLTDRNVSLECLTHSPFQGHSSGGDPGFGGPRTSFSHFGGASGRLENVPHNVIHDAIGGLMGDPDTAALDPIFWLHHSNIDRLWEVWRHRNAAFVNPTDAAWLTGLSFELHDASGAIQRFTPSQMPDTTAVLHGYKYDDISDPVRANPALLGAALRVATMASIPQPPQLVGTSSTAIPLSGPVTAAEVVFDQPTVQAARQSLAALAAPRPARAYLNLENVTGTGRPGTYEVYIDVPAPGQQPSPDNGLFVGLMSTFGVEIASRPSGPQAGSGITTVLEITDQVETLRSQHRWDESRLHVLFVQEHPPEMPLAAARAAQANLTVGRISVYYH